MHSGAWQLLAAAAGIEDSLERALGGCGKAKRAGVWRVEEGADVSGVT